VRAAAPEDNVVASLWNGFGESGLLGVPAAADALKPITDAMKNLNV
jgi:hypothetical protein